MHQQEKNIKGFNLLELIVVIVIIAVISAAAYPNFSSWRKERAARSGAIEIKSIIENIHAQSQRGLYGFVQVQFTESKGNLTVISRGMKKDKLLSKVRDPSSLWWNDTEEQRCKMDIDGGFSDDIDEPGTAYWSDDGSVNVDEDATNDLAQVSIKEYDNIAIDFINTSGAICFSSDGTWFQGNGGLLTGDVTHSVLYVCPLKNKVDRCIVNTEGIPNKQHEYIFEISWSRFGNVAMQKWNVKRGTWGLQ